jgi:rRNA maturation protein Nop10
MSQVTIIDARVNEASGEQVSTYLFNCPQCGELTEVAVPDLNCHIFRHGVYKANLEPIPPHHPKEECDKLVAEELVYGCCKPFRIVSGDPPLVEVCEYI